MLGCSNCPKEFKIGQVCEECSKLVCAEHEVNTCPLCKGKLRRASVVIEKVGNLDINWLMIEDSKQVSVVGTKLLPSYFVKIWKTIRSTNSQINVILLNSKQKSIELEKLLYERNGLAYEDRVISERSRYSIFCLNPTSPYFVLLNQNVLNERSAIFLTVLNIGFSKKWMLLREIAETKKEEIIKSLSQAVFSYNRKMGFPYVSADEAIRTFIRNSIINIQHCFAECEEIQELTNEKTYGPDLADYLQYKLDTTFGSMDFSARFIIYEVLQIIEKIVLDNFLIQATSKNMPLFQFLVNCFNANFEDFKQKYSDLPDVVNLLESANSTLRSFSLSTYEDFIIAATSVLETSLSKIEPVYISLAEVLDLIRMSDYYLEGLENNIPVQVPNIGSIYQYIKLLNEIFSKEGTYPEVRIMASYALEHTLMSWLLINGKGNIQLFEDYAKCATELANMIEQNLPQILRKNSDYGDFKGSPLRYEDAANKLLTLSKVARTFGDKEVEREAFEHASQLVDKYGLSSLKLAIYWTTFVETQNFSYLEKIHELMRNSDKKEMAKHNFLTAPLDLIIGAMLYGENVDQNIDEAENLLLESTSIGATTQTQSRTGINTTERFYHIFEMVRELLKYQGKIDNAKKAYREALILAEILEPEDPLQILSLKTRILYLLLSNDLSGATLLIKKLERYPDPEKCIAKFLDISVHWVNIISNNEERTFMHRDEFQYDGKDFWILVLQHFVFQVMAKDFNSNIAGSRAVVFVEGETDVLVFKEFLRLIMPREKVYFLDLKGFSNYSYYVESRMVNEMRIPFYLIFDGDTLEEKKRKTINLLSVPSHRTYTLKSNSIENYLLNPRAIVRAFPGKKLDEKSIEAFFAENNGEKDKKKVIKNLFKKSRIGSYNKRVAQGIAGNFSAEEVSPEVKTLLTNIIDLREV